VNQQNYIEVGGTIQPEKKVKVRTKSATQRKKLEAHVEARQAYWDKKRPSWKSQPIARVDSPLAFIEEKTVVREQNAKGEWVQRRSKLYYEAAELARAGKGAAVQAIAIKLFHTA
jgi:hypothetical protein